MKITFKITIERIDEDDEVKVIPRPPTIYDEYPEQKEKDGPPRVDSERPKKPASGYERQFIYACSGCGRIGFNVRTCPDHDDV